MPNLFREALQRSKVLNVDAWWSEIDDQSRENAIIYWNMIATEQIDHFQLTAIAEPEEPQPADGYWSNDFYEYLINHEVTWFDVPRLHICLMTEAARDCLKKGRISSDFACPILTKECLMKSLLQTTGAREIRFLLVPVSLQ